MKYHPVVLLSALIIMLVSITLISFAHKKSLGVSVNESRAVKIETASVTIKTLAFQFETLGSLTSLDSIDISPEIAGQIAVIHFTPGTFVKKGTILIQLDHTILESELASALANLSLSETIYRRTSELTKRKLASEQALDEAFAALHEKQNTVTAKRAQLEKLNLHAPFSGIVGNKKVSVGQYVKAGFPLVSLIANSKLRVEYNLPERLIARIHQGQQVHIFSDAFPKTAFHGVVNYIAPSIDRETRTIAVEALIDNKQNILSAGLFVRIRHQLGDARKRMLVPEESLIPTINGQKIFVLQDDKAITKRVKIGAHHDGLVEIKAGLKADDIIIVRGQHKLKEGNQVIAEK